MAVAVVGHVEWVDFAVVDGLPPLGEIIHAREWLSDACGGGGVAAVQLRRLAGACAFLTSIGADWAGERVAAALDAHGVEVHAAAHDGPQRRATCHLTPDHERTITVIGERHAPRGEDALDWSLLDGIGAVYFTGGDAGALRRARAAQHLVATPRGRDALAAASDVRVDVLVLSANDPAEQAWAAELAVPPRVRVLTDGGAGGRWEAEDGASGRWEAAPLPGEPVDSYGCGDTFAAVVAFGLGEGMALPDALELAARCGARCLTGRGPYGADLAAERRARP